MSRTLELKGLQMRTFLRYLTSIAVVASLVACQVTQPEAPSPSMASRLGEPSTLGPTANLLRPESRADRLRDALTNEVVTSPRILSYSEDAPRELLMSGRFRPDPVTCAPLLWMGNGEVAGVCSEPSESVELPGVIPSRLPIVAATPVPRPGAGGGLIWFTADRYFSPNQDEFKPRTLIDVIALGSLSDWTLDVEGQSNSVLYKRSGTHFNLPWDGRLGGKALPDGWYNLRLKSDGNTQTLRVMIDTVPPSIREVKFYPNSISGETVQYGLEAKVDVGGGSHIDASSELFESSGARLIKQSSRLGGDGSLVAELSTQMSSVTADILPKVTLADVAGNHGTGTFVPTPLEINYFVLDDDCAGSPQSGPSYSLMLSGQDCDLDSPEDRAATRKAGHVLGAKLSSILARRDVQCVLMVVGPEAALGRIALTAVQRVAVKFSYSIGMKAERIVAAYLKETKQGWKYQVVVNGSRVRELGLKKPRRLDFANRDTIIEVKNVQKLERRSQILDIIKIAQGPPARKLIIYVRNRQTEIGSKFRQELDDLGVEIKYLSDLE